MISEKELIEADYDGLSDSEILVLLIVGGDDGKPVSKSRLQKIAHLYRELYENGVDD